MKRVMFRKLTDPDLAQAIEAERRDYARLADSTPGRTRRRWRRKLATWQAELERRQQATVAE